MIKGKVTLSKREEQRLAVLIEVEKGAITGKQAAEIAGISLRHERRLAAAYRKEGIAALAHGNRGRKPHNAIGEAIRQQVLELATTKYTGFNHQHFTEKLEENEIADLTMHDFEIKLPVKIIPSLVEGLAGIPFEFEETIGIPINGKVKIEGEKS